MMSVQMKTGEEEHWGKCLAKREGNWYPAEIIEKRFNKKQKYTEYYVHFDGQDRRLDQWLLIDCIRKKATATTDHTYCKVVKTSANSDQDGPIMTRGQKRLYDEINHGQSSLSEIDPETAALERQREAATKVKLIMKIQIGKYEIDTWYFSFYPDKYGSDPKLWICEYCLRYTRTEIGYAFHKRECSYRQPPGNEIYRAGTKSIWEVDGAVDKIYCQNLCLLSKLFLDHKTLFFDISPFMFYVLCQVDREGAHIIGYFSKAKQSSDGYNLSCILTLPPYQRQAYGKMLIAFSYELSKIEGTTGSPEKPLSDLGSFSYRSYWSWVLLEQISSSHGSLSVEELSKMTSITVCDVIDTLKTMGLVNYQRGSYVVNPKWETLKKIVHSKQSKFPKFTINSAAIRWSPPFKQLPNRKSN